MKPFSSKRRAVAGMFGTLTVAVVLSTILYMSTRAPSVSPVSPEGIPIPFGDVNGSNLQGTVSTIGQRGTSLLRNVTFPGGQATEVLQNETLVRAFDFVKTPDETTISDNAPLSLTLPTGKKFYGYMYTSVGANIEKAQQLLAQSGTPLTYSQRFPGVFFASAEQRSSGTFNVTGFENLTHVQFLDPSAVTLKRNALYILSEESTDVSITVRGLEVCANGIVEGAEICDDGNSAAGDGCAANCSAVEAGWVCRDRGTEPYTPANSQSACFTCSDTDPTDNVGIRGIIDFQMAGQTPMWQTDECAGGSVLQQSCSVDMTPVDPPVATACLNGCQDGACIQVVDTPNCGNSVVEGNADQSVLETCDRGADNGQLCSVDPVSGNCTWCNSQCQLRVLWDPSCGDGIIQSGETCDDQNHFSGDGCAAGAVANGGCQIEDGWTCSGEPSVCETVDVPVCGDGDIEGNEVCDNGADNNGVPCTAPYDGTCEYCAADCTALVTVDGPSCGDGTPNGTEQCDDGNQDNTDACTNSCNDAVCGDSFTRVGVEQCDDGDLDNTDVCSNTCMEAICGDTIHQPAGADGQTGTSDDEECDDGAVCVIGGQISTTQSCDSAAAADACRTSGGICNPFDTGSCLVTGENCIDQTATSSCEANGGTCNGYDCVKNGFDPCDSLDRANTCTLAGGTCQSSQTCDQRCKLPPAAF